MILGSQSPVLRTSKLSKRYEESSASGICDVSISILPGEFVALCGPSGSGKSTLLNVVGLTDVPSSGELEIADTKVAFHNEGLLISLRRRHLGYIFQRFNLLPTFSVEENVAFPLTLLGERLDAALEKARCMLAKFGLEHKCKALPHKLSGGEMQRIAVARASIHKPSVVLADEPTGSLDSENGTKVLELLSELSKQGCSVLMATHSEAASQYASRSIFLVDGKVTSNHGFTW